MSKLYVLGLTGSIGMGKTTTANMFRDAQIAVWDADAAVHELYTTHTDTIEKIAELAPIAVDGDGVNRDRLRNVLQADKSLFAKLEQIVHPAIRMHRDAFLTKCRELSLSLAVVDIPLLFETGADEWVDGVLVVSTSADNQRARVLKRGMDEKSFEMILFRQTPDAEKRARADFVIETNSLEHVRTEVHKLIEQLTKEH
ncbi:dephospho-CoA kinase [Amylibacter kogurei]|uniref:Dephospho-CoA kinase n=1 Tax=Paramylibacter kogurei TaxID=1889778 RepID=A0A2G5KAU7_9RHOB|nr:dephospho-CoA kinase [Amylibacter kogurei]PIB26565.1 dephospho-CoA kinase [Amylibacter kogurei]